MSAISRLYHVADSFNLRKIQAQDKSNPAATELRNFRSSYNTKVFNVAANPTLPSQNGVQRDYDVQISEMEYRILRENVMNEANSLIEEPQAYYGFKINSDIANNLIRNCNALIRESQQVFVGETDASKMTQVFKLFNDLSFLYNENVADIKKDLIFKQTFHAKLIQIETLFEKIKARFTAWQAPRSYRYNSFKPSGEFSTDYIIEILSNLIYVVKEMFEIKSTAQYLADSDFKELDFVNRGQLEVQPLDGIDETDELRESDRRRREEEARLEDSKHRTRTAHTEYGDGSAEMDDDKPEVGGIDYSAGTIESKEGLEGPPIDSSEVHAVGAASGTTAGAPVVEPRRPLKLKEPTATTGTAVVPQRQKTKKDFPDLASLKNYFKITAVFNEYIKNNILRCKGDYTNYLEIILDSILRNGKIADIRITAKLLGSLSLFEDFKKRVQASPEFSVPLVSVDDVNKIFIAHAKDTSVKNFDLRYGPSISLINSVYLAHYYSPAPETGVAAPGIPLTSEPVDIAAPTVRRSARNKKHSIEELRKLEEIDPVEEPGGMISGVINYITGRKKKPRKPKS